MRELRRKEAKVSYVDCDEPAWKSCAKRRMLLLQMQRGAAMQAMRESRSRMHVPRLQEAVRPSLQILRDASANKRVPK